MENLMYALSNWINDSWILTKVLFSSVLKYEPIQQQIVKYMEHNVYLPRIEKKMFSTLFEIIVQILNSFQNDQTVK